MRHDTGPGSVPLRRAALVLAAVLVLVVALAGRADAGWSSSGTQSHSVSSISLSAPTGLAKTGSGTILLVTWADFSWNAVTGATNYEIKMVPYLGCLVTVSDNTLTGTSGRVSSTFLCLGTWYHVTIRAWNNNWSSPWSSTLNIIL